MTILALKRLLHERDNKELIDFIVGLYKYSKDNKDFIEAKLMNNLSDLSIMDWLFEKVKTLFLDFSSNDYLAKKQFVSFQKKLNKFLKFLDNEADGIELIFFFLKTAKLYDVHRNQYPVVSNVFLNQVKKIKRISSKLHDDLQFDHNNRLLELFENTSLEEDVKAILKL